MFLEILWRDVSYGARMLWQKPAYGAIAVVTLALAIGANSAIFNGANSNLSVRTTGLTLIHEQ